MGIVRKITITPVYGLSEWDQPFDISSLPFDIVQGVQLADVRKMMESANFDLWAKEYLSKQDIKELKSWRYGLMHVYEAEEHLQSYPEKESKELVHKVFLGLRIVRPTRQPYASLQAKLRDHLTIDPFTFSHPEPILMVPEAEILNVVRTQDAQELRAIAPALLKAFESEYRPVTRAIRNLEVGYNTDFVDVQHLLWVTGLDSLFTSREWKNRGSWVAAERIKKFLGADYRIYKDGDLPSYLPTPKTTVADVVTDVYKLRNYFAHGEWPGKEWTEKPFRQAVADEPVSYADMLREASSVILRASIANILKEDLLDLFGDKMRMNAHFAQFGIVRQKRSERG